MIKCRNVHNTRDRLTSFVFVYITNYNFNLTVYYVVLLYCNNCSLQIIHLVILRSKIEQGFAEIDDGKGIPHEQLKKEMSEWLQSFGPRSLAPISERFSSPSPAILT